MTCPSIRWPNGYIDEMLFVINVSAIPILFLLDAIVTLISPHLKSSSCSRAIEAEEKILYITIQTFFVETIIFNNVKAQTCTEVCPQGWDDLPVAFACFFETKLYSQREDKISLLSGSPEA